MLDSCMLYRHGMPLNRELLALLGNILAFQVASATHSLATRQPSYTSARKIHTGRAVRAEHYSHSGELLTPDMLQPCALPYTASTTRVWLATGPADLYPSAAAALLIVPSPFMPACTGQKAAP